MVEGRDSWPRNEAQSESLTFTKSVANRMQAFCFLLTTSELNKMTKTVSDLRDEFSHGLHVIRKSFVG